MGGGEKINTFTKKTPLACFTTSGTDKQDFASLVSYMYLSFCSPIAPKICMSATLSCCYVKARSRDIYRIYAEATAIKVGMIADDWKEPKEPSMMVRPYYAP